MTQGVQKLNGNLKPAIAIRAVQLALKCTCYSNVKPIAIHGFSRQTPLTTSYTRGERKKLLKRIDRVFLGNSGTY